MQYILKQFEIALVFVLVVPIAVVATGCGKKAAPRLAVNPVIGKLLINGQPAPRAEVTLRPVTPLEEPGKRSVLPYAIVQGDGTFRIGTYVGDDGAPLGEYAVTVVWPRISVEGGEEIAGPDRLQGFFNNPRQPAAKVIVAEGENLIPTIELKARVLP